MPLEGLAQEPAGANAGLAGFLRAPLVSAINHLLRSAAWPRARLKPFAGKRVLFNGQLWAFTLAVCDSGEVAEADPGAPDVQISFSPAVALRLLAGDQNAWREGRVEGDTEFAREILAIVPLAGGSAPHLREPRPGARRRRQARRHQDGPRRLGRT